MALCLIGLGSNLGDRRRTLDEAVQSLTRHPEIDLRGRSRWLVTTPVGGPPGQAPFLNGAMVLQTPLAPEGLLAILRQTESALGRRRAQRWGPRRLDLDLLLYDQIVLETRELTIPHPRMAWRRFVLQPAMEVAAEMVHPTTGWTIAQLLDHLNSTPPYIALAGPAGTGKAQLAHRLAERTGARVIADPVAPRGWEMSDRNSSGDRWATELEFLNRRAGVLDRRRALRSSPHRPMVSDFWLDQGLVYARVRLRADRYAAFRRRWEATCGRVVCPRFAVILGPSRGPMEGPESAGGAAGRSAGGLPDRLWQGFAGLATTPGHGPVLVVPSGDSDRAVADVLAAFGATGPETIVPTGAASSGDPETHV